MKQPIIEPLIELTIAIQQIPAPTFMEARRAEFIRDNFLNEGLSDVSIDDTGNVFARKPGIGDVPAVIVSAHIDTVFPESTDLSVFRTE